MRYIASAINEFYQRPTGDNASAAPRAVANVTSRDVVAVSAMEGTGWMALIALREVLERRGTSGLGV